MSQQIFFFFFKSQQVLVDTSLRKNLAKEKIGLALIWHIASADKTVIF